MILRKFGVKVLRERNAYWEAVNVMGETYCKIAFMNLRSGSCRYINRPPGVGAHWHKTAPGRLTEL